MASVSRRDKSLEEFDIIKLLLFFLLFVAVVMGFILGLIVPDVREYKRTKSALASERATTQKIYEVLSARESELLDLRSKNRKILEAFGKSFDEERFINYASQFFDAVVLEKQSQAEFEEDFTLYELTVTSQLDTPTQFYTFLESLNRYEAIVRTDFPIQMWVEDGKIHAIFNIKVYELMSRE
jgi:hypothetical protein